MGQKHKELSNSMSHQYMLLRLCLAHKDGLQVEIQKRTLNKQKHHIAATSQATPSSLLTIRKPGTTLLLTLLWKGALSARQNLCCMLMQTVKQRSVLSALPFRPTLKMHQELNAALHSYNRREGRSCRAGHLH